MKEPKKEALTAEEIDRMQLSNHILDTRYLERCVVDPQFAAANTALYRFSDDLQAKHAKNLLSKLLQFTGYHQNSVFVLLFYGKPCYAC